MSVILRRTTSGQHLFQFTCDAGCRRPPILAGSMPPAWEALRGTDGRLLHRCGECRFAEIAARLWTEAA